MQGVKRLSRVNYSPTVITASLTANMLGMALPITMIQIYDRIIPNSATETLNVLALGVLSAIVAEAAVRSARGALLSKAGAKFEVNIYNEIYCALVDPMSAVNAKYSSGELANRLKSIDKIRAHYCSMGSASLLDLPFVGIFLIMMLAISPLVGFVAFLTLCMVFLIVRAQRKKNLKLTLAREKSDAQRQSFLVQTLSGIEFIKSVGIEPLMERRYERLMSGSAPIGAKLGVRMQVSQGLVSSIGLFVPFVTTSVGAYLVIQGSMSVGGLAASILLTGRVIQPVLRIEAYWGGRDAIQHAQAELQSMLEINEVEERAHKELNSIEYIELKNVTWQPDQNRPPVLRDVSLSLSRGDCISIGGGQGSGRSSLLAILAGHLQQSSGHVTINGTPIADLSGDRVRELVCTLTRENVLLDGTLADNLTGFRGPEYLPLALEIADQIGIGSFIQKHSMGLGMRLYSGAKSGLPNAIADSIVIVGGLVGVPDVILFDEANSRLDMEQDTKLLALLSQIKPHTIIVMISHRPSYLRLANRHFVMEQGVLAELDNRPTSQHGVREQVQ